MNRWIDLYRFCANKFFKMVLTKLELQQHGNKKQDGGQLVPDTYFTHIVWTDRPIFTVFGQKNS